MRDVKSVVDQITPILSDMASEERRLLVARDERMAASAAHGQRVASPPRNRRDRRSILLFAFAGLRRGKMRGAREANAQRARASNISRKAKIASLGWRRPCRSASSCSTSHPTFRATHASCMRTLKRASSPGSTPGTSSESPSKRSYLTTTTPADTSGRSRPPFAGRSPPGATRSSKWTAARLKPGRVPHCVSLGGRGAAVIYNNVTEKRKAETALRESEARFREARRRHAPQIVWTAKADGSLDYYNRRSFEYTGMTPEETRERGWAPVHGHPDDRQASRAKWTNAVATGEPHEGRYRLKRASDGTYRWHLGRALPIRDSQRQRSRSGSGPRRISTTRSARTKRSARASSPSAKGPPERRRTSDFERSSRRRRTRSSSSTRRARSSSSTRRPKSSSGTNGESWKGSRSRCCCPRAFVASTRRSARVTFRTRPRARWARGSSSRVDARTARSFRSKSAWDPSRLTKGCSSRARSATSAHESRPKSDCAPARRPFVGSSTV